MALFRIGQMVKLVSHEPESYLPPIGAVGTVLRAADDRGDYSVLFHGHPWNPAHGLPMNNTSESNDWEVPGCQLAPATPVPDRVLALAEF